MTLDWSQATPNAGLNPQPVYSGSGVGVIGSSSFIGGKLGIGLLQIEANNVGAIAVWVRGRLTGLNSFFTMSLTNTALGNNFQTVVTGSGLYTIAPNVGIGSIEFAPVVTAVSASTTVAIAAGYTQG